MAIELLTPTKVEQEPEIKDKKRTSGNPRGNLIPVHNAHLVVADQVRQQLGWDKVLLTEYEPPHVIKKKPLMGLPSLLKMLELAIDGIRRSGIERRLSQSVKGSLIPPIREVA